MKIKTLLLGSILLTAVTLQGCVPLVVGAAGGIGGYAVAKDMEDGELIDNGK